MNNKHDYFMRIALEQAALAFAIGEVPVGACIVKDEKVIALGHNTRESQNSPIGHAEINAVQNAAAILGTWRLDNCTLYVTLEPCPMCAGAAINARLERVVFGASDPKAGSMGSLCNLAAMPFPTVPYITSGILVNDCSKLLADFFTTLRK